MTNDEKNELKQSVKIFGCKIENIREKYFRSDKYVTSDFKMDTDLVLHFFNEVKLILDEITDKL